ncbi:MAG: transcription termination/antitermination protein NusG [bacterium]|nr:transcription termination/antitermination protein NusG [bacterium]
MANEKTLVPRTDYANEQASKRQAARDAAGPKWYLVQCVRATDQQAIDAFARFKIETYHPKILQLKPLPRRRMSAAQRQGGISIQVPTEVPLFPRYIFANFDIHHDKWHDAFEVAGVGGLVCRDRMPVWMPDDTIASIKRRENNGVIPGKDSVRAIFSVGDQVTVTNGPFASFPGIVEEGLDVAIEKLEANMRIKVAVNIFGRATPVELEYWQVAKQE